MKTEAQRSTLLAAQRCSNAMLVRWVLAFQQHTLDDDLSVPLALSVFMTRTQRGKIKMPQPVRKVLSRWLQKKLHR